MSDVVLDDKSARIQVGVMIIEKGSLIMSIPQDGGHTYQKIDNPMLISMVKHLVNPLPGQISKVCLSLSVPLDE